MSDVWEKAKKDLKGQMTSTIYNNLIEPIHLVSCNHYTYTLGTNSSSIKDRLENMPIGQAIERALVCSVGGPVTVEYILIEESPPPNRVDKEAPQQAEQDPNIQIRDHRKPGRYYIDSVFVRGGYAAKIGPGGVTVYNILVASADNDYQDCYPSYGKIAELGGMSKTQAKNKIKELEGLNIISVERRKNPNNPKINDSNLFTLINDKEWKKLK